MKKMKSKMLCLILLAGALSSCATTNRISFVPKSDLSMDRLKGQPRELGEAGGRACRVLLLGMVSIGDAAITKATDRALAKFQAADALKDATVKTSLSHWALTWSLLTVNCTTIKGQAIQFNSQGQ